MRPPLTTELAAPSKPIWHYYLHHHEPFSSLLRTEAASHRYHSSVYDLFQDMEDKDGHLYAVLQSRKFGLLSRDRKILPASEHPTALKIADFIRHTLEQIPNFENVLFSLLDAISKGISILEIIWTLKDGKATIAQLKPRSPHRFVFDPQARLRLLDPSRDALPHLTPPPPNEPYLGYLLPERKFLTFSFNATPDNPYGKGLCLKAYWYYWFKKNNLKFWVIFNEKFGAPTLIARYSPGTSEQERQQLRELLESIQNDVGVTIPESVAIQLLEARRSGTINTYKDLADWCNDEISKIVLGQTLTTAEGRRSGSLALARVHQEVRNEYIEADAKALMEVLNTQLIPYLVYFNFGTNAPLPRFVIDTAPPEELQSEIEVDKQLVNLGVPLPLTYFYEKYRRPAPKDAERSLRYDDNNLYQYHLLFGVLTINEVRETLGLSPVPWGDQPPVPTKQVPQSLPLSAPGSGPESRRDEPKEKTKEPLPREQ